MKIYEKYHTQKGLTLVEVLAALVILGIVFVGIMTVFPQMTLFNEKTGTKLDTMNFARQEMNTLTSGEYRESELSIIDTSTQKYVLDNTKIAAKFDAILDKDRDGSLTNKYFVTLESDNSSTTENTSTPYYQYDVEKDGSPLKYKLTFFSNADLSGAITLYKIILQVESDDSTSKSETYGYIEVKKEAILLE